MFFLLCLLKAKTLPSAHIFESVHAIVVILFCFFFLPKSNSVKNLKKPFHWKIFLTETEFVILRVGNAA